jgi:hypothetical protein
MPRHARKDDKTTLKQGELDSNGSLMVYFGLNFVFHNNGEASNQWDRFHEPIMPYLLEIIKRYLLQ